MTSKSTTDPVNHPAHYTQGKVELQDALQAALTPEEYRGFLKGTIIKYLWRAGKKLDAMEDCRKGQWYLTRLIQQLDEADDPTGF